MPFRTPAGAPRDLLSLIDAELRTRLEEALDHACLDAMVSARRAAGRPLPVADDPRDREEFTASVRALLERLRDEIPTDAGEAADGNADVAASDEEWRLLSAQLGRAKALPDYWQRFEIVRQRFSADYASSGGARRGVFGRWLGRRG
ncbi:MAG: hypothetical protein FJZ38_25215 [Candidatus Rokubacteria bacterium]|nr:hypothetical protein [Candidatus Rokubacteria bacterium]